MRLLIKLNAMFALWKQCQQGSSNEGWAKYIQATALALGFPSETRFTPPLADAPEDDMSRKKEFGPDLQRMAGTTRLELATSAVTVHCQLVTT
jgi:hypothetical protein